MSDVYRCTKEFFVTKYDDDCSPTEEIITIKTGSLWVLDDHPGSYIGGEITLISEDNTFSRWVEVSKELFENCFEEVQGDE